MVVTGHSLGGAVAALLVPLLSPYLTPTPNLTPNHTLNSISNHHPITGIAFGPPCCCDLATSIALAIPTPTPTPTPTPASAPFTSVVLQDDVVSRLTPSAIQVGIPGCSVRNNSNPNPDPNPNPNHTEHSRMLCMYVELYLTCIIAYKSYLIT